MTEKAVIYCRVSATRQKTEGSGLESQEHRCRMYAQQNNYDVAEVFQDDFSGGGNFLNRPAMRRLIAFLDDRPNDNYVVIFDDLKRFARDIEFHWKLRKALKQREAVPKCLNFNFEETPEGEFIETVLASMGQLERKQNQRQVCQKMKARLEKGYWSFQPPIGMHYIKDKLHGKVLAAKEPEAIWVKQALEGYAYGSFASCKEVQRFLAQKLNRSIYNDLPRKMLLNPLYAGFIEYKPWEVSWRQGQHKGLIRLEIFERIQEKLDGKMCKFNRKDDRDEFPLRGFVCCQQCERPMTAAWSTGRKGKKYPYYRCPSRNCIGSINKDEFENKFLDLLKLATPKQGVLRLLEQCVKNELDEQQQDLIGRAKQLEQNITDTENERSKLIKLAVQATSNTMRTAYEDEVFKADEKIKHLKNELFKIQQPKKVGTVQLRGRAILEDPYTTWKAGDLKVRQDVQNVVFGNTLRFAENRVFETAKKPCVYRVFSEFNRCESNLVDIVKKNWNLIRDLFQVK